VLASADQLKLSADQILPTAESNSEFRRRDAYDAPETAAGINSPAGDVWSVGVTLVAALTQNVAFVDDASPTGRDVPGTVPEPYRGIARECLHLDPKRRCSIAEIQARLQPAGRSVPVALPPPSAPASPVKRGPIAAALLAVAVVVALVVFFSRAKRGTAPAPTTTEQTAPQTPAQIPPAPKPNPAVPEPTRTPRRAVTSQGGVVRQVIPDVSKNSRNTIRGTIKVTVRVEVDPSGKVTTAKLKTPGPSRYFAGLALKAAQRWEFAPQPTAGTWLIQFHFKRSGTQASAEPVTR
jgi:TonB family protein